MKGNWTPAEEAINAIAPWRRADLIRDLLYLAAFLECHPDVPVPDTGLFIIPALGDGPDERRNDVLATADALGVVATVDGDGFLSAVRQFGPVTLRARTPARKAARAA